MRSEGLPARTATRSPSSNLPIRGRTWSVVSKPTFSYTFGTAALLAIDPVKTNVLYTMAANDGLEVTTDGGVTWSAPTIPKPAGSASGGTPNQPGLDGVAADPNHSGVVYVVGGNSSFHPGKGYLLKSTDFGNTWTLLTSTAGFGSRIFINPKNSLEIYGTSLSNIGCTVSEWSAMRNLQEHRWRAELDGVEHSRAHRAERGDRRHPGPALCGGVRWPEDANVYTSADGGTTWKTVFTGAYSSVAYFNAVVRADPNAALTAYTIGPVGSNMVSKTTDGGATWTPRRSATNLPMRFARLARFRRIFTIWWWCRRRRARRQLPAITSVVNAAGFQPGFVANSWVTIQGTNLAPQTDDWSHSIVNGALPTSLDGVSVTMGGKAAYIYYISPGQLNVLAPDVPAGPVTVTVTTPGGTSASFLDHREPLWAGILPMARQPGGGDASRLQLRGEGGHVRRRDHRCGKAGRSDYPVGHRIRSHDAGSAGGRRRCRATSTYATSHPRRP